MYLTNKTDQTVYIGETNIDADGNEEKPHFEALLPNKTAKASAELVWQIGPKISMYANSTYTNRIGYYQLYVPDNQTCTIDNSARVRIVGYPEKNGGYHQGDICTANITFASPATLNYASCDNINTATPLPTSELFTCWEADQQWHVQSPTFSYATHQFTNTCTINNPVAGAPNGESLKTFCKNKGFNRVTLLSSMTI